VAITDQNVDTADAEATGTTTTDAGDKPGSLLPVIRIIPPEAYENPTWKGLAYFARDVVVYVAVLVGLALTDNPLLVAALWVVSALIVSSLFIVGHDAAHEALFKTRRMNSIVGHLAMLPSWHVYEAWVLGHNRIHHGHTCREGMDFVWHPVTPEQYRGMSRLHQLRHKAEWSWFGAGVYYVREIWWNKMIAAAPPAKWRSAIRRDKAIVAAWLVVATVGFGWLGYERYGTLLGAAWMVLKLLVVPFLAFCYVIGSVVHVHHIAPDIRWWPRREWTKFRGQMEGTTIMRVAPGMNFFFHWIMVHIPHHVDMRIPMYGLETAAAAISANFPEVVRDEKLRYRDFVSNTRRCKLYDFEAGQWMTYGEAKAKVEAMDPTELEERSRSRLARSLVD
jgi:omega-6 fatty acid desaturase (delta-12 desaturase)